MVKWLEGSKALALNARIAFGPLRVRRIALAVWIPLMRVSSGDELGVMASLVVLAGVAALVRSLLMGINVKGGQIFVVNLFRTTAVKKSDIGRIEFVRCGVGAIRRLVIWTVDGRSIPANGASVWVWPLVLPIHKPSRYRTRTEHFMITTGLDSVFKEDW